MPGYKVPPNLESDDEQVKKLTCCYCGLLLCEARQNKETAERCCFSCIPSGAAGDDYWPDKAVDKEVKKLPVTCTNKGCQWRGSLETFLKEHQQLCDKVTALERVNECLQRDNECLQEELYAYKQQAAEGSTVKEFSSLSGPHEGDSVISVHPKAEMVQIKLPENYALKPQEASNGSPLHKDSPQPKRPSTNSELDERFEKAREFVRESRRKQEEKNKRMDQNDAALWHLSRKTEREIRCSNLVRDSEPEQLYVSGKYVGVSPQATPHHDSSMHFCWEIRGFLQKKQAAIARPEDPLVSLPQRCPSLYCLQVYLYLNGYGRCLGSHVSVFLGIVRGPYDDRLKWPAAGTISIILLDRKHQNRKLWGKTCILDPFFQRPPKEISEKVAAGCSDFLPLSKLNNYIENDSLYWEFSFNPPQNHDV